MRITSVLRAYLCEGERLAMINNYFKVQTECTLFKKGKSISKWKTVVEQIVANGG